MYSFIFKIVLFIIFVPLAALSKTVFCSQQIVENCSTFVGVLAQKNFMTFFYALIGLLLALNMLVIKVEADEEV